MLTFGFIFETCIKFIVSLSKYETYNGLICFLSGLGYVGKYSTAVLTSRLVAVTLVSQV